MKRFFALLLAVLLIMSMTACTGPAPATTPETTEPNTTTAPQTQESPFVGETVDNVYTNEFLGITCKLDEEWTVFNKEQLAQLAGLTSDILDNDVIDQQMAKGVIIYAFYAQAQGGAMNMNISLERLSLINGILLDEQGYVEIAKDQMVAGLETAGLENVTAEPTTLQFAGAEHAGIRVHGTMQGVDLYETVACVKNGNYMACVVACSVGSDVTADMMELFKPVEG